MNSLTPNDAYQLMNEIVYQATGKNEITVVDTSTFVSVGETVLRTGTENTLSAISTVIGRTIFSTRPYKAKLSSLEVGQERWGGQTRKITYLMGGLEQSEDWNTVQNPNQLADGNSVDMYKIKKPKAVQLNFYGTQVLQKHITRFRDQLSMAFSSEREFIQFISGVMVEFNNEIELVNEGRARAVLLNYMAGMDSMGLTEVDLVAEYNTRFGTTYTRAQLLSTYMSDFMKFLASQIKVYSERLTDMSGIYHANLPNYDMIPRHSPKSRQKMIMYNPIFIEAESQVYSSLFNPQYLEIGDFEGVNYWQDIKDPTKITVKPNILNVNTGASQNAAETVTVPYVLGMLYDEEALGVMPQFDYASTTPFNSAGGYYNMYIHWRFNTYNDFTENAILFVLGDGGAASGSSETGTETQSETGTETRSVKAARAAKA